MIGKIRGAIIALVESGIAQTLAIASTLMLNFVFYGLEIRNIFVFILLMLNLLYTLFALTIGGSRLIRFVDTGESIHGSFLRPFATAATISAINIITLQLVALTTITFDPPYPIQN